MALTPIPTKYNGYAFRSRLEARWAYYFDLSGIAYHYEPEGFVLSDGQRYLPDFYLPDYAQYVEIKSSGDHASKRDVGPLPEIWVPEGDHYDEFTTLERLYDAPAPEVAYIVWDEYEKDGFRWELSTYGAVCALIARGVWVFVEIQDKWINIQVQDLEERTRGREKGWCTLVRDRQDAERRLMAYHYDGRPKHFVAMDDAEEEGVGFRVFWGDPREAQTKANSCAKKVPLFRVHADAARQMRFESSAA
jgi:hypothetical protein